MLGNQSKERFFLKLQKNLVNKVISTYVKKNSQHVGRRKKTEPLEVTSEETNLD